MTGSCGSCGHGVPGQGEHEGDIVCLRFPPAVLPGPGESWVQVNPVMGDLDRCGEWVEQPERLVGRGMVSATGGNAPTEGGSSAWYPDQETGLLRQAPRLAPPVGAPGPLIRGQ